MHYTKISPHKEWEAPFYIFENIFHNILLIIKIIALFAKKTEELNRDNREKELQMDYISYYHTGV